YIHSQAIGGAIEKIEGFFALCKARGLTGDQGVIVPKTNVQDLQLSPEIVTAVAAGDFNLEFPDLTAPGAQEAFEKLPSDVQAAVKAKRFFHIYAVENARQAAELLTGVSYATLIKEARKGAIALAKGR
ncbi:MAG: hypothetical protein HYZ74_02835, partial [Elusimicrobia bacterium]|nr:hypothetical protein [Elusimicrobiota bacterium]